MSATATWLEDVRWADCAFVLEIEGCDHVYTTTGKQILGDSSIQAAWSATDWDDVKPGLKIVGEVGEEISAFDPTITPSQLGFEIVDWDGSVIQFFFGTRRATLRTPLTADIDANDTTLTVKSTSGWAASGTLYLGLEAIAYASLGVGGTTFEGCTRGKYGSYARQDDGRFSKGFRLDRETTSAPVCVDAHQTHFNRGVSLWLTHYRNQAWETRANAHRIWSGRIKSWKENGEGVVTLACTSLHDVLSTSLLADQYQGKITPGVYVRAGINDAVSMDFYNDAGATTTVSGTLGTAAAYRTVDQIVSDLNDIAGGWTTTLPTGITEVQFAVTPDGFVSCWAQGALTGGFDYAVTLRLHRDIAHLLGYDQIGTGIAAIDLGYGHLVLDPIEELHGYRVHGSRVARSWWGGDGNQITVTYSSGDFVTQPDGYGWLRVGDTTVRVTETAADVYTVHGQDLVDDLNDAGINGEIAVRQVWLEVGPVGKVMLACLVSTGVADLNMTTYDRLPASMSVGLPYDAVDTASVLALGETGAFQLVLEKPRPFREICDSVLAVANAHLVWRDGRLSVVRGIGEGATAESVASFNDTNQAQSIRDGGEPKPDRSPMEISIDGIINRATLKYCKAPGSDDYQRTETVVARDAIDEAGGQTKSVEVEADGYFTDAVAAQWRSEVAAVALAYFSRPWATVERSYDFSLEPLLYCGCRCDLTDPAMVDPATGTRGITSRPVWLLAKKFDWSNGEGKALLALSPSLLLPRPWAPAAMVDHAAANGGLDAATSLIFTCLAHQYSDSTQAADAARFVAGDKIHIIEVDPASGAARDEWYRDVASQTGNTVTVTVAIGTPAWDSAQYYVIEPDDASTVLASQFAAGTFIADDANDSTGRAALDYHVWGGPAEPVTSGAVYTALYRRPSDSEDNTGEPLSVWKLGDIGAWMPAGLNHHTAPQHLNDMWVTARSVTGTTRGMVYGPIFLADTSCGARSWSVTLACLTSAGTSTWRVTVATQRPYGTADSAVTFDGSAVYVEVTTTSTTLVYKTATITPPPLAVGQYFLVVEAVADDAARIASLYGVQVREATL
jgi:hypothetical protein